MSKLDFLTKSMVSLLGVAFSTLQVLVSTARALEYNEVYTPTSGVFELYKQPTTINATCSEGLFEQSQSVGGVPIRVVAPATSGTYPVLLFSHGVYGVDTEQAWLADYLAKYGYIVLSMQHIDSVSCNDLPIPPADSVFTKRSSDVNTVLNNLTTIQNSLNSSSGQTYTFDTNHIGFVGYSLGAETGLMKMKQATYLLRSGPVNYGDARIKAFFLMAGNFGGNTNQTIPGLDQSEANLAQLTQPMFWISGGADTWMYALSSWDLELGAPGGNYYMHAPTMNHYQYETHGNSLFHTLIEQFACAFFDAKLMDATLLRNASALTALNNATAYSGDNPLNTYELVSDNQPTDIWWWGTPLTVNSTYVGYATHTQWPVP